MHLFQNEIGEVYKALNHGEGVIANITHEIANNGRLPLYVAEGTSKSNLRKINSVEYLRHFYRTLHETTAAVFVFGHSADPNDAHNGLFKAEVIHRRGPWRNFEAVEYATLEWVDCFNNRHLLEPIGNIPPAEAEEKFYEQCKEFDKAA